MNEVPGTDNLTSQAVTPDTQDGQQVSISPIVPLVTPSDTQNPSYTLTGSDKEQIDDVNSPENVAERARLIKPTISKLTDLLDSIGRKMVKKEAKKSNFNKEQLNSIDEAVTMGDETHDIIVLTSSRIIARRVINPETVDILALSGALTEWSIGLVTAIRELRENRPLPASESPGYPTELKAAKKSKGKIVNPNEVTIEN